MTGERAEHFGALHLHRGRLWVGKPRGVRVDLTSGRWMGLCMKPSGIRCYEGGYLALRPHTAWDDISSISVRFDGRDLTGWSGAPASALLWGAASEDPRRAVSVKWLRGNAWNRYVLLMNPMWDGDVTEQKIHAVRHLPDALRRHPELRPSLATADSIGDLLGRLAAAPDVAAVVAILDGG